MNSNACQALCYSEERRGRSAGLFAVNRVRLLLSRPAVPRGSTPPAFLEEREVSGGFPKARVLPSPRRGWGASLNPFCGKSASLAALCAQLGAGAARNVAGSPQADGARSGSSGCSSAARKNTEFRQLWVVFFARAHQVSRYGVACLVKVRRVVPDTCPPKPCPRLPVPSSLGDIPPITSRAAGPRTTCSASSAHPGPSPSPTAPSPSPGGSHVPALGSCSELLPSSPAMKGHPNSCSAWVLPYYNPPTRFGPFGDWLWCCEGFSAASQCLQMPGEPGPGEAAGREPRTDEGSHRHLQDGASAELNGVRVPKSCWIIFPSPSSVLEK